MKTEAKRSGLTSSMDGLGWSLPKQGEGSVANSRLGRSSRVLPTEDEDVSEALRRLFEGEGLELILNARTKCILGNPGVRTSQSQ
jgi:hypothetical protein